MQPDRFLLRDGRVSYNEPLNSDVQGCMLFLFSDILLHTAINEQLKSPRLLGGMFSRKPGRLPRSKSQDSMADFPNIASAQDEDDLQTILDSIPQGTKFEAKYVFPLIDCQVTALQNNQIAFKLQAKDQICTYICGNPQERQEWIAALQKSIVDAKKRKDTFVNAKIQLDKAAPLNITIALPEQYQ